MHRRSNLRPLREVLRTLGTLQQGEWASFLRHHDLGPDLPAVYEETIARVADFADPILSGAVTSGHWEPVRRTWLP